MREPIDENILNEIRKLSKLEISDRAVKSIIRDYIERTYHVTVKDVNFLVNRELEGYGPMEHEVVRFKGCDVILKGE